MTTITAGRVIPPTKTNLASQIALLSALFGLIPIALVFGFIGLHEIERRPHESGSRIAWAAIIIAIVEIAVVITVLVIFVAQGETPPRRSTYN